MNYKLGLEKLGGALRDKGFAANSHERMKFDLLRHQLLASLDEEKRLAFMGPQNRATRSRLLLELNRLAMELLTTSFTTLCLSSTKNLRREGLPPELEPRFQAGHALLIGVSSYEHLNDLPATQRDVESLADLLKDPYRCGYLSGHVRTITGQRATASAICRGLEQLSAEISKESTVLVYFSGHGGRLCQNGVWQVYLCGSETDPTQIATSAIAGEEFTQRLRGICSSRLLVILDACHSGGGADPKALFPVGPWKSGLSESYYAALSHGRGRVIIASSAEDQVSWIRTQGDLSLFTFHLHQALEGAAAVRGDGLIRVLDVFHYVSGKVQRDRPEQTPILKVDSMDLNYPIALAGANADLSPDKPVASESRIKTVREQIIANPIAGAFALGELLEFFPEFRDRQGEVDLKRTELLRLEKELRLFGRSENAQAEHNRAVFFLLEICKDLQERP